MKLTPDALNIGGIVLDWYRLAFLLGAFALLTLVGRRRDAALDRAAWWTLIAAVLAGRLGYAAAFWPSFGGDFALALRSVVDLRTGGFNFWWALAAGGVVAVALARVRARLLLPSLAGAVAIAALPLLLRPAASVKRVSPDLAVERFASTQVPPQPATFGQVGKPTLVNVWASWCPPCRLEMPVLVNAARRGYPIALLNAAEPQGTVRAYLAGVGFPGVFYRDSGLASNALQVSGLPTTLLIGADGQVLARHFGPLDPAQLQAIFDRYGVKPTSSRPATP